MAAPLYIDPRFDALRNALYHAERANFLDLLNRFLNLIVVLLGASVAGKIATHAHVEEYWLEFGVVLAATLQLVLDFGARASTHKFLQKRYYDVLAEMENEDLDDEKVSRKWSARLSTIASDEPMPMRALDAIAYNKALSATYSDPADLTGNRLWINWWRRRLRHLVAFQSADFPVEAKRKKWLSCFRKEPAEQRLLM